MALSRQDGHHSAIALLLKAALIQVSDYRLLGASGFKTFFTVLKPKAANSRVSDCYLTQTQQFSAISWREQGNFQ